MKPSSAMLAGTLGMLLGAPALAAEGEEATRGLPQFDPSHFASQIFWLLVAFAVLYYLFTRKGLPRVAEILEARQDRIAADLDQAARLRKEAEETLARYEAMIADAQSRAHESLRLAQERLSAEFARRQAELDRELGERIRSAEAGIEEARRRALAEVDEAAAEVVRAAAARLAGLKLTARETRAAVKQLTTERIGA